MAHIASFIEDAENILTVILERQSDRENRIYRDYKAARTIQRWFRGYITRKHMQNLHQQATIIQKHWRGHYDRHLFFLCLKQKVKEFYEENYNRLATIIQKTWRGYVYRQYVFSYLKLKKWKQNVLVKNRYMLQITKNYRHGTWSITCKKAEREAEEWLSYILFKTHHLLRTYQRKGVYSLKEDTKSYSPVEELLQSMKFFKYMKERRKLKKPIKPSSHEYLFHGVHRKCEKAWLERYAPNMYSIFASGIYGEEEAEAKFNEIQEKDANIFQDDRMKFGLDRCARFGYKCKNDMEETLDYKTYLCPTHHRSMHFASNESLLRKMKVEEIFRKNEEKRLEISKAACKLVDEVMKESIKKGNSIIDRAMEIVHFIMKEAIEMCEHE